MFLIISLSLFLNVKIAWADNVSDNMVTMPGGVFTPFFKEPKDKDIQIKSFLIDKFPVTKNDFNNFLIKFPNYKKNKIIALFVDQRYLQDWTLENLAAEDLKTKYVILNINLLILCKFKKNNVRKKYC